MNKPYERKLGPNSSRWYVRFNGKDHWLGRDRTEAMANWDRLKAGKPVNRPTRKTVQQLLKLYIDRVREKHPDKYAGRREALRPFVNEFGSATTLSKREVTAWIDQQPQPDRTRRMLRSVFRALVAWELIHHAPIEIDVTVQDVVTLFMRHAEQHYRKNGKITSEVASIKSAIGPLLDQFGETPAKQFGTLKLEKVREAMIARGWCRSVINHAIMRVRRVFRYATSKQQIPVTVWHQLQTLSPLLAGRTEAPEAPPVLPVPDDVVDATLPYMTPIVADIVRVQRRTGMRPGEVCAMLWSEIETTGDVWLYRPSDHKLIHKQKSRVVAIGPKAQSVLMKYRGFGPVFPGRKGPFTVAAYRRCITRACEKAFGMPDDLNKEGRAAWRAEHCWHPNQLRHTLATEVRRVAGLDVVAATLGHSKVETSQIYAEKNLAPATDLMRQIG